MNSRVDRAGDGYCRKATWGDLDGWERQCGNLVREDERAILRAMDDAFVSEMNKEIEARREAAKQASKNG